MAKKCLIVSVLRTDRSSRRLYATVHGLAVAVAGVGVGVGAGWFGLAWLAEVSIILRALAM